MYYTCVYYLYFLPAMSLLIITIRTEIIDQRTMKVWDYSVADVLSGRSAFVSWSVPSATAAITSVVGTAAEGLVIANWWPVASTLDWGLLCVPIATEKKHFALFHITLVFIPDSTSGTWDWDWLMEWEWRLSRQAGKGLTVSRGHRAISRIWEGALNRTLSSFSRNLSIRTPMGHKKVS